MVRSFFLSIGLFVTLCGGSLLFVDKLVLNTDSDIAEKTGFRGLFQPIAQGKKQVVDPPEWVAFGLLAAGAVTVLQSVGWAKGKKGE